jgi:hypothetical protein
MYGMYGFGQHASGSARTHTLQSTPLPVQTLLHQLGATASTCLHFKCM